MLALIVWNVSNFLISFLKIHLWIFGRFCDDPRIEYPVACSIWRKKSVESNLDESEQRSVLLCHSWPVASGLTCFDSWTFRQTLESIRQWHMNNLPWDFPISSWMKRRNRYRNLCLRVWYWLIVRVAKKGLKFEKKKKINGKCFKSGKKSIWIFAPKN